MIEMTIKAVSSNTLRLDWSEPDGATCWSNIYRREDGSIYLSTDFIRKPAGAKLGRYGNPASFWRSFNAAANSAEREARIKLLDATDCHALLDAYTDDVRAQLEEDARKRRIEALRAAVLLIRQSDGDELAAAMLHEEVAVARWATALRETGADL